MGAESSTESGEEFLRNFQSKYAFHKEINDSRFGDIQIYKENGGDGLVFVKSQWCPSEEDYNIFLKNCNRKINNPHNNILKMIGYTQSSETQLCGDFSKITVYFEYYVHNMEKELDRRHNRSEYFNEQEIWFLLDSVVSACAFFEGQKAYHGDIRPQNVLLTNAGFVKMADQGMVSQDKNGYIKALQCGEQVYLSPLLMRALQQRDVAPMHNHFKSDVFSLGMTMLEVCCLYTSKACYDFSNCQILRTVVEDLLGRARQRYSSFLVNIIQELLQEDEANRPSFLELQTLLAPYKEQIETLTPFTPEFGISPQVSSQSQVLQQPIGQLQQQQLPQYEVQQQQQPNGTTLFQSQVQPQQLNTHIVQPQDYQQPLGAAQSQIVYQQAQPFIQSPESKKYQQQLQQPQDIQYSQIIPQQQQPQQTVYTAQPQPQTEQVVQQQQQYQPVNNVQTTSQHQQQQPIQYSQPQTQTSQQQQPVYISYTQPQQQQSQVTQLSSHSPIKTNTFGTTSQYVPSTQAQIQSQVAQQHTQQQQYVPQQQQQQPQQQYIQQQQQQPVQQNTTTIPQTTNQYQPQYQQQVVYSQPQQQQQVVGIDQRVQNALKNSEEAIQRHQTNGINGVSQQQYYNNNNYQ